MDEKFEDGELAVLMRAEEIPLGSFVTKRTGSKRYTIVDQIRVFGEGGSTRIIKANDGARLLAGTGGDFNVVAPDTLLLWRVDRPVLIDHLTYEVEQ